MHKSRANRLLAQAVRDLPGVTFHDLYQAYPDLAIDVPREQDQLLAHDVVVLQHPMYWYSTPALLKEWQDLVLEHGWAYGREGTALRGKILLQALTTGGGVDAYSTQGLHQATLRQFLLPLEATARLCRMRYLPPFVVHGTHRLDDATCEWYAREYRRVVERLRDGAFDLGALEGVDRINTEPPPISAEA